MRILPRITYPRVAKVSTHIADERDDADNMSTEVEDDKKLDARHTIEEAMSECRTLRFHASLYSIH